MVCEPGEHDQNNDHHDHKSPVGNDVVICDGMFLGVEKSSVSLRHVGILLMSKEKPEICHVLILFWLTKGTIEKAIKDS